MNMCKALGKGDYEYMHLRLSSESAVLMGPKTNSKRKLISVFSFNFEN